MRTSTTLSIIGFLNVLLGAVGLIFGLVIRIVIANVELWSNPAFRRISASFPFLETILRSTVYDQFLWWTTVTDFVVYAGLLFAGYWLYTKQPWARLWSQTCCGYLVLRSIAKLLVLLLFTADTGIAVAFVITSFCIEIAYPILAMITLSRPVIIEGMRNGVRERAAAPSLRALSERHRRASTLPRD
jgi:hypothetical protein